MRAAAKAKLKDLRALLGGDVTIARAELLKHVSQIEMEPHGKELRCEGGLEPAGDATPPVVPGARIAWWVHRSDSDLGW